MNSPVHEMAIVATVTVGGSGDPWEIVQIGSSVYAYCNYDQVVQQFAASNLALQATHFLGAGGIPKISFLMRGPSSSLYGYTQTPAEVAAGVHSVSKLNTSTLGVISSFVVTSDVANSVAWEGVIVGNYLYGVFIHTGASPQYVLKKFDILTGVQQAFSLTFDGHALGGSRFNYIQADGTMITLGRYPVVYTIDTTTDTVTTFASGP